MTESTSSIYDRSAGDWSRREPVLLSDFTARPFVLEALGAGPGMRVLDLGCGEGFVARRIAGQGAAVTGFDISAGMIEHARAAEEREPLGITYHHGDARGADALGDASFDAAIAVFLFNYVETAVMTEVMATVRRVVRPGGRFVFTVPHPSLPFMRAHEKPFYFDRRGLGYFAGRDQTMEGRIWRRDGQDVPVRCVHKTFADYFEALGAAGFVTLPRVTELRVTDEHIALDPGFFGPLAEQPLHVMFEIGR